MVVESLGGWGEEAVRVVRRLAGALARHTGEEEEDVLRHQFRKIANSLQRGNATILGARMPGPRGVPHPHHRRPALDLFCSMFAH